jgi:uncharacterized repeat protein (TIGR03803 family)
MATFTIQEPVMRLSCRFLFLPALLFAASSLRAQTYTESVVYSFVSGNGSAPASISLIQASDGNFYGVTDTGGTGSNGTVFRVTPTGTYDIIYNFCTSGGSTCSDGANPTGGLIQAPDGNLYGTTRTGGANKYGTAFSVSLTGTFKLIYTFCSVGSTSCTDGKYPAVSLVQGSDGNFYGGNNPTFFKLTPAGTLTTLHTFSNADGYRPQAGAVESTAGTFFGTSVGSFYQITSSGGFTDIGQETCEPNCPASDVESTMIVGADGQFYGTSDGGGADNDGEVFKVTSAGDITDLHDLCSEKISGGGCTDGENSQASLVEGSDGNFYGTAQSGGTTNQGVVFKITSSGTYTNLYTFCPGGSPCSDGSDPQDGLVQGSDGNFYGISSKGIYKIAVSPVLSPPVKLSLSESSVKPGAAFTLTYTVFNANSKTLQTCFATEPAGASGWTGGKSGSTTAQVADLTAPSTAGTYTYGLTCGGTESGFATLTVAAAKTTPTVTLAVTPTPLSVGQTATVKATVAGSGATPTGKVDVVVGSTTLFTLTLSSGTASTTASTNGVAPATYPLVAEYEGDTNYNAANSSTDNVVLAKTATTTTLTAAPNPVTPPADVTLKATVKRSASGATGVPTGTVTFYFQTEVIGTVGLNGSGVATLSAPTSGIGAGSYAVTAKYNGDTSDDSSTSSAVSVMVE